MSKADAKELTMEELITQLRKHPGARVEFHSVMSTTQESLDKQKNSPVFKLQRNRYLYSVAGVPVMVNGYKKNEEGKLRFVEEGGEVVYVACNPAKKV